MTERRAGILLPLFSLRSARDWGVGDLGDLGPFCRWLASAGHTRAPAPADRRDGRRYETSPYGALTAFALDPLYLALDAVEDFAAAGGVDALSPGARLALDAARGAPGIAYAHVRHAKSEALAAAFARYEVTEAATGSTRETAFARFVEAETLVARRLRAVPRAARPPRPAALDDVGGRRAGCGACRLARAPAGTRARVPLPCVGPVAAGGAVERRTAGRSRRRRPPPTVTCRSWCRARAPTCGHGSASSVSTRPSVRRPTPSPRRDRTGACR